MARLKDREKALALRKEQQMSYSQIKKTLGISKSTLSYWLRDFPLPEKKIKELQRQGWNNSEAARERFRNTMRRKREERLKNTYEKQKKLILPLNKREIFITGLFLYWGEGTKSRRDSLEIANSDPAVIKFFIYWLTEVLSVPKNKIRIQLHSYSDMNIDKEMRYWSKELRIPRKQFHRSYVKKTSSERINHKGSFGHGTCKIRVYDTQLTEKIFMSIKAVSDRYQ